MKLSKREAVIFDFVKDRIGEEVALDDIMGALKLDPTYINARLSVNTSVKMLSYKLSSQGYSLERVSKLGTKEKAIYRLTKPAGKLWPVGAPDDPE